MLRFSLAWSAAGCLALVGMLIAAGAELHLEIVPLILLFGAVCLAIGAAGYRILYSRTNQKRIGEEEETGAKTGAPTLEGSPASRWKKD
ncbi:MAG: hypothetical protein N2C14_18965, partial [Planctomycetales bacterium]